MEVEEGTVEEGRRRKEGEGEGRRVKVGEGR